MRLYNSLFIQELCQTSCSNTIGNVLSILRALKLAVIADTQPTASTLSSTMTSTPPSQKQPVHSRLSILKDFFRQRPLEILNILLILALFAISCHSDWPLFSLVAGGLGVCLLILSIFKHYVVATSLSNLGKEKAVYEVVYSFRGISRGEWNG